MIEFKVFILFLLRIFNLFKKSTLDTGERKNEWRFRPQFCRSSGRVINPAAEAWFKPRFHLIDPGWSQLSIALDAGLWSKTPFIYSMLFSSTPNLVKELYSIAFSGNIIQIMDNKTPSITNALHSNSNYAYSYKCSHCMLHNGNTLIVIIHIT